MKDIIIASVGCLTVALLIASILVLHFHPGPSKGRKVWLNALTDGIHESGKLGHLLTDASHALQHLAVKIGSDAAHIAVATADAEPLGICIDKPGAAEEPAAVAVFGVTPGTLLAVGAEEIAAGAAVYAGAAGKLTDRPAVAGNYWRVGKALTACGADGQKFEIAHHAPVRVAILANAADLAAIKAAATADSELMFLGA